jgi:hypothetical protein
MKAILKNVTIDNNNEELVAFAQTIDFTELFDHVKTFAGIECSFYQPEITTNRGRVYVSFMSDDITPQAGLFAPILRCCYIYSFNNSVYKDPATNVISYSVSVNVRYEHKGGGSNGMDIVFAVYCRDKWTFYDVGSERGV